MDRIGIDAADERLTRLLRESAPAATRLPARAPLRPGATLTAGAALTLFEDQLRSRAIDVAARALRKQDRGYYTIQSAGHEQNAVLGALLRPDDPCLLHYRSGALVLARARRAGEPHMLRDVLLSICASSDDPISQGRHKVWGSRPLQVLPQTSTIASHLPKAMGLAFALGRSPAGEFPEDAIVCCSFGDASANHASALSAIQAARFAARRGNPVPLLLVCEDNGLGISVETPRRWIEESFGHLPHLTYLRARGDLVEIHATASRAIETAREARSPVFLHLDCVRLFGHAGSDVETNYRSVDEIRRSEARDPLLENARLLIHAGVARPDELVRLVTAIREEVAREAERAAQAPHLDSREAVMSPIAPFDPDRCRASIAERSCPPPSDASRAPSRRTLGALLGATLADELERRPELLVFGQDVARKGGVYSVTTGLHARFGPSRVFDTLLDETTILGVAQGAALAGFLPVPEIQYLAYLHNALDQLRGEACSQTFFSSGQYACGMVLRVASFAYQRGFGGHFHNDNSIAALRDIPGLVLCAPSRAEDGAALLRGCLALAAEHGRVVVFLEPIALYHEKDLYAVGDQGWLGDPPPPNRLLLPHEVGVHHESARDVLLVSYANGLRMSLRAARRLADEHGIRARVLDLRWLAPLPVEEVARHAQACGGVLVVDECRASGGVADTLLAALVERGYDGPLRAVRSADSYVPLGPAASHVLLQEGEIVDSARALGRV